MKCSAAICTFTAVDAGYCRTHLRSRVGGPTEESKMSYVVRPDGSIVTETLEEALALSQALGGASARTAVVLAPKVIETGIQKVVQFGECWRYHKGCKNKTPILPTARPSVVCFEHASPATRANWKRMEERHGQPLVFPSSETSLDNPPSYVQIPRLKQVPLFTAEDIQAVAVIGQVWRIVAPSKIEGYRDVRIVKVEEYIAAITLGTANRDHWSFEKFAERAIELIDGPSKRPFANSDELRQLVAIGQIWRIASSKIPYYQDIRIGRFYDDDNFNTTKVNSDLSRSNLSRWMSFNALAEKAIELRQQSPDPTITVDRAKGPVEPSTLGTPDRIRPVVLSDIESSSVDWLWHHRIAAGSLTVLFAPPGVGKGTLTAALARSSHQGWNTAGRPTRARGPPGALRGRRGRSENDLAPPARGLRAQIQPW